jgi:hypothetical protein
MTSQKVGSGYWFSLVGASPTPESEESVNVALVVGNGAPYRLEFQPKLPRLSGLIAPDEIKVYEAVLESIAEQIIRGIDVASLQAMMGPQLRIARPRALLREPSDDVLERLRDHFLSTPSLPYIDEERLLVRRAQKKLNEAVEAVRPPGVIVMRKVRLNTMYEHKLERYVHYKVPEVANALRSDRRDLLVDSVLVEPGNLRSAQRQSARISRAFYAFKKLETTIRQVANKEIRRVAVIHPGPRDPNADETREWLQHMWDRDADRIIDGNRVDVQDALREEAAWVASNV